MNKDAELMNRDDVFAMFDALGRSKTAVRNRALLTLFWRDGLRCAEALSLLLRDLDIKNKGVRVRKGKNGKPRTVPLDVDSLTLLEHWLTIRSQLPFTSQVLFCTMNRGRPLDPTYVRRFVRNCARKAGVTRRVHPHAFRHLFAVELDEERVPVRVISGLLGHSNVSTTDTYLRHHRKGEHIETIAHRPGWLEDVKESG